MILFLIILLIAVLTAALLRQPAQRCSWCGARRAYIEWRGGYVCGRCAERYEAPASTWQRPRR